MHGAKTADDFYANAPHWREEIANLRELLLAAGFDETIKWGQPTYTVKGQNVVGLGAFKSYFGLWFFQGAALKDNADVLINAQPGKTKNLRQWRMTSADEIRPAAIERYLEEAKVNAERA